MPVGLGRGPVRVLLNGAGAVGPRAAPSLFLLKIVAKARYPFYFIPRMHPFRTYLLLVIAIALGPLTGQDLPELKRRGRQIEDKQGELGRIGEAVRRHEHATPGAARYAAAPAGGQWRGRMGLVGAATTNGGRFPA